VYQKLIHILPDYGSTGGYFFRGAGSDGVGSDGAALSRVTTSLEEAEMVAVYVQGKKHAFVYSLGSHHDNPSLCAKFSQP
jgi:hypothetical protein